MRRVPVNFSTEGSHCHRSVGLRTTRPYGLLGKSSLSSSIMRKSATSKTTPPAIQSQVESPSASEADTGLDMRASAGIAGAAAAEAVDATSRPAAARPEAIDLMCISFRLEPPYSHLWPFGQWGRTPNPVRNSPVIRRAVAGTR